MSIQVDTIDIAEPARRPAPSKDELVALLTERGCLAAEDATHLSELAEKTSEPLDILISQLGFAAETDVAEAYAALADVPYIEKPTSTLKTDDIADDVNLRFLRARRCAPVAATAERVDVVMADPFDAEAIDGVGFAMRRAVNPSVAPASMVARLLDQLAPAGDAEDAAGAPDLNIAGADADATLLRDLASGEPAVRTVRDLIAGAARARASDVHVEPAERDYVVRHRVDGQLTEVRRLSRTAGLSAISRMKILSQLDIAEQRRPQDGRATFAIDGGSVDLRLSTTPTVHGESLVVRLLDQRAAQLELNALGFSDEMMRALAALIREPNGILLVTGPTGSGKTTTLYSLLSMLTDGKRKILTVEDPVEYKLDGISQTQVNQTINLTFANALRSFLRHDPDVIMVGEIRDLETARIAMRAALTGHLVLSTLHTNSAAAAVTRLKDMGLESYLISSTLIGVVGQRLVRRRCKTCVGAAEPDPSCATCGGSGLSGRMVIAEVLSMNDALREQIRLDADEAALMETARAGGAVDMRCDGEQKAKAGLTTPAEVETAVGQM